MASFFCPTKMDICPQSLYFHLFTFAKKIHLKFNFMKRDYLLLILLSIFSTFLSAQVDPGTTNLKHQWTFDDGTALDVVGGVEGTIVGNGVLSNKGFNTTNGGYMSFPGAQIAANTYTGLTMEVWCTSAQGKNTGWTMLSFLGESDAGGWGRNYTFISIARAIDGSMAALETTAWDGVSGPEYDDGKLHHFVQTIDNQTLKFYVDGALIATDTLAAGNSLAGISSSLAYLGRGGWTADPNWLGIFHKYSLYDKALSTDEILYLFQAGAEAQSVISVTTSAVALDSNYPAETFFVSSSNIADDITISAPEGITVMPTVVNKNLNDQEVAIFWDGSVPVDGTVTIKSGATEVSFPVKTADDSSCFNLLYPNDVNYVTDPGLNSVSNFTGWGTFKAVNVISSPESVYCGANSMQVGDGVNVSSGSLNVNLTGVLEPSTTYRVRVMVKTMDGNFQVGLWGWSNGEGDINHPIDTQGEWQAVDFTFTTGAVLGANQGMFVNNYLCTGTIAFADNWEMYMLPESTLSASKKAFAFDPEFVTTSFTLSGNNLSENAVITAPDGILVDHLIIMPNDENKIQGDTLHVSWNTSSVVDGKITISSSGLTLEIPVKTTLNSNSLCMTQAYPDKVNLVAEPYLNDISKFGGWGGRSLVSIATQPDSVYCGSHTGKIEGTGSMDVVLTGLLKKGTQYASHAMVKTVGGTFQMGVWGYDALAIGDKQDTIDTKGLWEPMTFYFTTSDTLGATAGVFFNNYQRSGTLGYIDNWEIVELGPVGYVPVNNQNFSAYFSDGKLVAAYNLNSPSQVSIQVYNMQGVLVYTAMQNGLSGMQHSILNVNLSQGVYLVRLEANNQVYLQKLIQ